MRRPVGRLTVFPVAADAISTASAPNDFSSALLVSATQTSSVSGAFQEPDPARVTWGAGIIGTNRSGRGGRAGGGVQALLVVASIAPNSIRGMRFIRDDSQFWQFELSALTRRGDRPDRLIANDPTSSTGSGRPFR